MINRTLILSLFAVMLLVGCSDDSGVDKQAEAVQPAATPPSAKQETIATPEPVEKKTETTIADNPSFVARDLNGDGILTAEEFISYAGSLAQKSFARYDTNGDSFIDSSEFTAVMAWLEQQLATRGVKVAQISVGAEQRFTALDSDGDSRVSVDEYQAKSLASANAVFAAKDSNGDKQITVEEFSARPAANTVTSTSHQDGDHGSVTNVAK